MFRGDRLRELREKAKLSQEELAAELGVDELRVHSLELGCNPSLAVLAAVANYFQVSMDYLCGRVDDGSCVYSVGKYCLDDWAKAMDKALEEKGVLS